jgi:hypothetical protein
MICLAAPAHLRLESRPLHVVTRCPVQREDGVGGGPAVGDVAVPSVSEVDLLSLPGLIVRLLLVGEFNAENLQISIN